MIVIGWSELPSYAIDCINYLNLRNKITILTDNKKARNLIKHSRVKIISLNKNYTWKSIGVSKPKYFFFTGWNNKAFISLAKEQKTKNICLIDNTLKKNLRQMIGKFYFKYFLSNIFDAAFVPGKNTQTLLKYFNFKKLVLTGMYSCNNNLFKNKKIITKRKYDFIFVGKFIPRKNLDALLKAFKRLKKIYKNSNLLLVGGNNVKKMDGVKIIPHTNSNTIANFMNNSKCLVLPSYEDHWGVVVHEGICSGCLLILSNNVGSKDEFLKRNGYAFDPYNDEDLSKKMENILNMKKKDMLNKSKLSLKISKKRSVQIWKKQFFEFLKRLS